LRLEIGEPDFITPSHIVQAAYRAARSGVGYTQSAGDAALLAALSAKASRLTGHPYEPTQMVVTQGAAQGCALALDALVDAGDQVLIPDPAWPNYEMQVLARGAEPVRYPLRPENGFLPDPDEMASLLTPRTRAMILNSPSNPTGAVMPPALVEQIVDLAAHASVTVLSDEVYEELIFSGKRCNAARYNPQAVVGIYSMSKTYAMTGWRVGYLAAPRWLAPTLVRLQEARLSCVSAVSQAAALEAVTGLQDDVVTMRQAYLHRRDLAVQACTDAGLAVVVPQGTFYLMFPLAAGVDSRRAAFSLVDEGVAVAPGTAFGDVARSFVRLSLAVNEATLTKALEILIGWHGRTDGGRSASGQ
jgi:aspartate/methionine/tyrosine aminotransferase